MLAEGAEQDLEAIYDCLSAFDSVDNATYVLDELLNIFQSLSEFPERGSVPKELVEIGIKEVRQAIFKPYRVIFRVIGRTVMVEMIVDGRRDMQALLNRRLLGVAHRY